MSERTMLLERDVWAERFKSVGEDAPMEPLRKGYSVAVKAINAEERLVDSVISTGSIDRDRDTIDPKKWSLKHFRKNPVVQWAHDSHIPAVAKTTKIGIEGESLKVVDKFPAEEDGHGLANMLFNLVKGGFIKAKSVGFLPERNKFTFNEERGGFDFHGQELLEHSFVNVPSNPEALIAAKASGIDIAPLREWAEKVLDEDGTTLVLPRESVERALRIVEEHRSVISMNGFKLYPKTNDHQAVVIVEIPLKTFGHEELSFQELEGALTPTIFTDAQKVVLDGLENKEPDTLVEVLEDIVSTPDVKPTMRLEAKDADGNDIDEKDLPILLVTCSYCDAPVDVDEGGIMTHDCQKKKNLEPEPGSEEVKSEDLLSGLLDGDNRGAFNDDELKEIGEVFQESFGNTVREAVGEAMQQRTGKLD